MLSTKKWKTQFFLVAFGQAVSMLGSHGVQFALIWWLAEKTSSPFMLGMSGIAAYLPMAVLSPIAGVTADRCNRKWISITADLSMGFIAAVFAVLLLFYDLPAWTVLLMLMVRGVGSTFQQPAIQSIIPQLVPKDQLVQTGGWMQLLNAGSFLIGPVIGAVLYAAFPMPAVLITDIIGAAIASIALGVVEVPVLERTEQKEKNIRNEFREGLEAFTENQDLKYLIAAEAGVMFFYGPLSSFYPLMTSDYFGLSAYYGSIVELSFAVGMIGSSLLFARFLRIREKIRVSFYGLFLMGAAALLCGSIPPVYAGWFLFTAGCILLGAGSNVHTIPLNAYIQETMAPEKMGRAFSVITMISSVSMPAGLLVSSPIAEIVGVNSWFQISGILMLLVTVLLYIGLGIARNRPTS